MKYYLLLISISLACSGFAQVVGTPYDHRMKIIREGVELNDQGKYEEAIKAFNKVPPCDSLYSLAMYELALTQMNNKMYKEGITTCKKGLTLHSKDQRGFYDLLGSGYDYLEMQDSAIYFYKEGLKQFPTYAKYYFEIGVSYYTKGNDTTAMRYLIKANSLNAVHAGTHFRIAAIAARNGYYASSLLAYQYGLLCDNSSARAFAAMNDFEKACNNNVEPAKTKADLSALGAANPDLDEIIRSRAVQIPSYKSKVKLPYDDIIKQCQITSEKYKYNESDKGFFRSFYGKFFSKAWKAGYFEASMYSAFSSLNTQEVQSANTKHAKDINAYRTYMITLIDEFRQSIPHEIDGKPVAGKRYFYDDGNLQAVGTITDGKKTGKWIIYYYSGTISSEGNYENDEPSGNWIAYAENGLKKSEGSWKNGKREGPYSTYYENGNVKEKGNYVNGEIEGAVTNYYSNGAMKEVSEYKKGKADGQLTTYDITGIKSATGTYVKGYLTGSVTNYFNNGKVSEERNFKEGFPDGASKIYYRNGKVKSEGSYKAGKRHGRWVNYYENGTKSSEGDYTDGNMTGAWKEYAENGMLTDTYTYNSDGSLTDAFTIKNRKGQKLCDGIYKKGKLKEVKYYNSKGEVISDQKFSGKTYHIVKYYLNGNIDEEGDSKEEEREGKYVHHYMNGSLGSETYYKKGNKDGPYKKFYYNGKVQEEYFFNNDEKDGYFRTYYIFGQLATEGYYRDGVLNGPYTTYHENGMVKEKYYYMNGDATAYGEMFDVKGRIEKRVHYSDIISIKTEIFDTLGRVIDTYGSNNGDLNVTTHYFNKSKHEEYVLVHGRKHGKYTEYYPNGKVKCTGEYFYGSLNGTFTYYDPQGRVTLKRNYVDDEQEGVETWYDVQNKVTTETPYRSGSINGVKKWYYDNGKVQLEKNYYNNEEDSTSTFYGEDGSIAAQFWYDDGVFVKYSYCDKSGKLMPPIDIKNETVKISATYANGNKSREAEYVYGLLQGKRTNYLTTGKLYTDGSFKDDQFDGLSKEYYTNGQPQQECTYKNGELYGVRKQWYANGKLESETNYYNGVKYGEEKLYDMTGKLIATYYYVNGDAYSK